MSTDSPAELGLLSVLPPPPAGRTGWPWTQETPRALYAPAPAGGWPRLSIVCPSFQQGRYLEETIRSVLLQNYPGLELIVMDGGSTDETPAVLARYAPWLKFWESNPDRGQSHALNKACGRATGTLLGWINSDDYYLPGAFAAVARGFRVGGPALIYGDEKVRQDESAELTSGRRHQVFRFQIAVGGVTLPSHATFWPRVAHVPFNETLRFTMDAEFFKRLAAGGLPPRHLPEFLAVFRRHGASKTATLDAVARAETEAWSRNQPWTTPWLWRLSNLIERLRAHQ